jgi:hypothetical protein
MLGNLAEKVMRGGNPDVCTKLSIALGLMRLDVPDRSNKKATRILLPWEFLFIPTSLGGAGLIPHTLISSQADLVGLRCIKDFNPNFYNAIIAKIGKSQKMPWVKSRFSFTDDVPEADQTVTPSRGS